MLDQYDFICTNCQLVSYWNGAISKGKLAQLRSQDCDVCKEPLIDNLRVPEVPILTDAEYQKVLSDRLRKKKEGEGEEKD
jgi:hypothetical protein